MRAEDYVESVTPEQLDALRRSNAEKVAKLKDLLLEARAHLNFYDPDTVASGIGLRIDEALGTPDLPQGPPT